MKRAFGLVLAVFLTATAGAQAAEAESTATTRAGPEIAETYRIGNNAYVRALAVDEGRGSLWVGTSVGAMEVDLEKRDLKNVYTRKEGLANEYVFAVTVAPDGAVWMGTNAGGTSVLKDGKMTTWFPMHGLADYWVYSYVFGDDGDLWIGTWDGVSRFNFESEEFTTYRKELINVWVYGLAVDDEGRVWMGTEGGVSMYDHGKWSSWTHDDGLGAPPDPNMPRSHNTGLGTRSRHDLSVAAEDANETFNPNYVFAAHYDKGRDVVWFGTWGGGASSFDGGTKWVSINDRNGLAGNIVYAIAQEPDGTLWFGTNRGASRWDGERWMTFDTRHGLVNNHVYAIAVDPKGMIWIGTKGGVARLEYPD